MQNRRDFMRNAALCGITASLSTLPAFRAHAQDVMRLFWWGPQGRAQRTLAVAKLYNSRNADVRINGEAGGSDYWTKLTTMMAGGNAPDIFQLEPSRFADYSRRSTNLPLNDYVGDIIRTDKLSPGVMDLGTVDGKITGIPLSLNAFAMFYDTEAFEKAGIAPPTRKTTWDDFARMCIDLTKAVDKKNVWAVSNGARYSYALQAFLEQRGKQIYSAEGGIGFDLKDAEDWYGYWDSLDKAGGCVGAEIQALDKSNVDSNPMTRGNSLIVLGFSNQLTAYQAVVKSRLAISTLPVTSPDGPSGHFYRPGLLWSIAPTAKKPELAAQFIDFFINDVEAGKILDVERGVPVNEDVKSAVLPLIDESARTTVEYVDSLKDWVIPNPPVVPLGATEFDERVLRPIADWVAFGKRTPKEAAAEVVSSAKRILRG